MHEWTPNLPAHAWLFALRRLAVMMTGRASESLITRSHHSSPRQAAQIACALIQLHGARGVVCPVVVLAAIVRITPFISRVQIDLNRLILRQLSVAPRTDAKQASNAPITRYNLDAFVWS